MIQVMSRDKLANEGMEIQVRREIGIQSKMHHKNILSLYGFFYDNVNLYIVLEYAPGPELYQLLTSADGKRLGEPQTARYISHVTQALRYCQQHNVIHRCARLLLHENSGPSQYQPRLVCITLS
jgi:serine/threonine protein kinase